MQMIQTGDECSAERRARVCLAAFSTTVLLSVVGFFAALAVLRAVDRLPPPPVSGTWCIDGRFVWLRDNPDWKNAALIAVGSSVTWRNLDFHVVRPEGGIINAAPCALTVNQTRYMTEFLLSRASNAKTVMMVLAPRDFQGCSRNPTAFFDPDLVDQFIDRKLSNRLDRAWLRFRNFRLKDVFFHVLYAEERRSELQFDEFGSGPLVRDVPDVGYPVKPESSCYSELTGLAIWLESKGIQFVAVTFPVMPGWAARHDRSRSIREQFRSAVVSALAPTRAILIDGMTEWQVPDSAFTDPVHLQWAETAAFTRYVWKAAQQRGADLPHLKSKEK